MLASQQHFQLMAILSEHDTKFEDLVNKFSNTFSKPQYFQMSWVIQHLILHNVCR